jgi:hypothetical protein
MNTQEIPGPVRTGSVLLVLAAAAAAGMIALTVGALVHFGPAAEAYREAARTLDYPSSAANQVPWEAESALVLNLVVALLTMLAGLGLAVLVRRPLRWAQISTWVLAVAITALLFCGLNSGPSDAGSTPGPDTRPMEGYAYALFPGWYPTLDAIVGLLVIALVIAAAVMLARSSVIDFYRLASRQPDDPRWVSFMRRHTES